MRDFRAAAESYREIGWTTIPLMLDSQGFPKRPFTEHWQETTLADIEDLPWERARGIGVVLGRASGGLEVLDLDSPSFALMVRQELERTPPLPYWVETVRQRGHLYVVPKRSTEPRTMTVSWGEETFHVELKGQGQQVAAPPGPGYRRLSAAPPLDCETIAECWAQLAQRFAVEGGSAQQTRYPRAWQQHVTAGDRNNALYVEACRLKDAGMPFPEALEVMLVRFGTAYDQGGLDTHEIRRTIQSAYRRRGRRTYAT